MYRVQNLFIGEKVKAAMRTVCNNGLHAGEKPLGSIADDTVSLNNPMCLDTAAAGRQ
jgi:hypothetical protein